jgi:hypothetical protein
LARAEGEAMMQDSGEAHDRESQPTTGFDRYRSLLDPALTILVPTNEVPPFRFKVGGWELLQSGIDVGDVIKTRVAARGFFLFRINGDQSGGVELLEPPTPVQAEHHRETE